MGDDAHQPVTLGQACQHPDRLFQRVLIQGAKAPRRGKGVSSRMPPAALCTSSERPRASAREALEALAAGKGRFTLRRVPL